LSDPFNLNHEVCIPDNHVVPSKKVAVKIRGTFATGTNSLGFITANPFFTQNDVYSYNPSPIYEVGAVAYTDGSAIHTQIEPRKNLSSPNGIEVSALSGAPYSGAQFDETVDGATNNVPTSAQSRVVGAGLRIRYTGTKLNEGGSVLIGRREDGESLQSVTYDGLASRMNTKVAPLGSKWHEVTYLPVQPDDYDYCKNGVLGSEGLPYTGAPDLVTRLRHNMGFFVKSAAASQPFEWEYIVHLEYLGKTIDNISKSHSDIVGISHVRNAIAQAKPEVQAGPGFFSSLLTSVGNEILESAPKLLGAGLKMLI
jgi:hypothetical protein